MADPFNQLFSIGTKVVVTDGKLEQRKLDSSAHSLAVAIATDDNCFIPIIPGDIKYDTLSFSIPKMLPQFEKLSMEEKIHQLKEILTHCINSIGIDEVDRIYKESIVESVIEE